MTMPVRVVSEPDKEAWLRACFVTEGLTRDHVPWVDAVHSVGNRIVASLTSGTTKPLYVLFYAGDASWNQDLASVTGVTGDGVWLQPCLGPEIYAHVTLATAGSDIRAGVADAYRRVFELVVEHTAAEVLGELAEDGVGKVGACVGQSVNDPALAGVFAGSQPCVLPEPADWLLQDYVRVSLSRAACELADLVSLEEDEQKAKGCGAFPGAKYRVEVRRDLYPRKKMKPAWYGDLSRRLCLAGDAGLALAQRFSLPVVAAECPDGELPVWVVDPPVVGVQWYDPVELMLQDSALWWSEPQPERDSRLLSTVWPLAPYGFSVPRIGWLADRPAVMASPELGVYFGSVCRDMLVRRDVAEAVFEASQGEVKMFDLDDRSIE